MFAKKVLLIFLTTLNLYAKIIYRTYVLCDRSKIIGLDGEQIVAKVGNSGLYGIVVRTGSFASNKLPSVIDKYYTYVIDKDYKLYRLHIFINNYSDNFTQQEPFSIPENFKLIDA